MALSAGPTTGWRSPNLADEGEIVPLDGKTLRRSYDTGSGQAAIHMVHAWAVKNRLVLGQFHGEEALEEISIIPELLRVLGLKGCLVTTDALGCHTSTAEQVVEQEADYVLAVKANQPKLHAHLQQLFDRSDSKLHADPAVDYWGTQDENHGRCETRQYWTTDPIEDFAGHALWPGLRLFGMVEATRRCGTRRPPQLHPCACYAQNRHRTLFGRSLGILGCAGRSGTVCVAAQENDESGKGYGCFVHGESLQRKSRTHSPSGR